LLPSKLERIMKKMDQPTRTSRDESGAERGSGRSSDAVRNAESTRDKGRPERTRPTQDDLILHDDDEAELDLPR
jgi:hypothetical protein